MAELVGVYLDQIILDYKFWVVDNDEDVAQITCCDHIEIAQSDVYGIGVVVIHIEIEGWVMDRMEEQATRWRKNPKSFIVRKGNLKEIGYKVLNIDSERKTRKGNYILKMHCRRHRDDSIIN